MGKLDSVSKVFVQKPEIFCNIFKLVFHGTPITIRDPVPMDAETMFAQQIPKDQFSKKSSQMTWMTSFARDVVKHGVCATDDTADYMVLAVENQSYIDTLMPARVMIYDAMTYHVQMETLKAANWPHLTSHEFLTGVPENIKLKPVMTVVCYFGTQPWHGPKSLHEILEIQNSALKALIPDYPIYIIDPHVLTESQLACLDTSLREVFMSIKASPNRKLLKEIVNSHPRFQHMDPDAVNLIKTALNINIKIDLNQKEINMCQAVEEWKQEIWDEGKKEGKKEGYDEGKCTIASNMLNKGQFSLIEIATLTELPLQTIQALAEKKEPSSRQESNIC